MATSGSFQVRQRSARGAWCCRSSRRSATGLRVRVWSPSARRFQRAQSDHRYGRTFNEQGGKPDLRIDAVELGGLNRTRSAPGGADHRFVIHWFFNESSCATFRRPVFPVALGRDCSRCSGVQTRPCGGLGPDGSNFWCQIRCRHKHHASQRMRRREYRCAVLAIKTPIVRIAWRLPVLGLGPLVGTTDPAHVAAVSAPSRCGQSRNDRAAPCQGIPAGRRAPLEIC